MIFCLLIEQVASYIRQDLLELTEALLQRWTSWADEAVLKDNPDLRSFVNHRYKRKPLFKRIGCLLPILKNKSVYRRFLDEVEEALVPLSKVASLKLKALGPHNYMITLCMSTFNAHIVAHIAKTENPNLLHRLWTISRTLSASHPTTQSMEKVQATAATATADLVCSSPFTTSAQVPQWLAIKSPLRILRCSATQNRAKGIFSSSSFLSLTPSPSLPLCM